MCSSGCPGMHSTVCLIDSASLCLCLMSGQIRGMCQFVCLFVFLYFLFISPLAAFTILFNGILVSGFTWSTIRDWFSPSPLFEAGAVLVLLLGHILQTSWPASIWLVLLPLPNPTLSEVCWDYRCTPLQLGFYLGPRDQTLVSRFCPNTFTC